MQQPLPTGVPRVATPSFHLIGREPVRPAAILLAAVAAFVSMSSVLYALRHNGHAHHGSDGSSTRSGSAGSEADDDNDDPSQVDTIVLGDPSDAPVPARRGDHVSPVHAFVIVRLPRFGEQVGLIPDTPAGHLLYGWLAAFNQTNYEALAKALPNVAPGSAAEAQMRLRRDTGGFNLLSAKEVQPGVLVFRLRDQTPAGDEALGTLQVRPGSDPAEIASFSLRVVASPGQGADAGTGGASPPR